MAKSAVQTSPQVYARVTGVLYLLIIIFAGFSQGYVRAELVVPGDAVATAQNIMAAPGLFRFGFAGDLIAFILDAIVSVLFYVLLRPVSKTLALITAALRLLAHPAIAGINLLNHYMALQLLGGADYLSVFSAEQLQALALVLMEAHTVGYLIAGAFFGLHCLLLGYLLYKSEYFPAFLGVLMAIAALGYLAESFGNFLLPGNEQLLAWVVGMTAAIGEVTLTIWLLGWGVKKQFRAARVA